MDSTLPVGMSKDTLLLIPCSGAKRKGHKPSNGPSILSQLPVDRAHALATARAALHARARVDETRMPAYLRYSGELYRYGATAIGRAIDTAQPIAIISGAYGVALANEPIGWYEKRLVLSDWPSGLLEACLSDYARGMGARSIVALVARTSPYATLIKRVKRHARNLSVTLVSPLAHGGEGAQGKVPRAQGQAIAALIRGDLPADWRSTESLALATTRL